MSGAEVRALALVSWRVVRGAALAVPVVLALGLVAATLPVLDQGHGLRVLRGAGVLLACAWAVRCWLCRAYSSWASRLTP